MSTLDRVFTHGAIIGLLLLCIIFGAKIDQLDKRVYQLETMEQDNE